MTTPAEVKAARELFGLAPPFPAKPAKPAPDSRFVALWDVKHGQCRYGLGDPLDIEAFRFCAAPTVGELSWCRHHMALVYTSGERRKAALRRVEEATHAASAVALIEQSFRRLPPAS